MAENLNGKPPGPGFAKPRTGSGFTNLQKVIGANQNNKLGSAINSGVSNATTQVKMGVSQAQQNFNQNLNANRLDSDANKQKVNNVLANPVKATDDDFKTFQTFRAGQYAGPKELDNSGSLNAQVQQTGNLLKGGGDALLQRFAGGNQYTSGLRKIDNMLLGQTAGNDIKQARQQIVGLNQGYASAQEQARQQAMQAEAGAKGFSADIMNRIGRVDDPMTPENEAAGPNGGMIGQLYTDVNARANAMKQSEQDLYERLKKTLAGQGGEVGTSMGMNQMDADVMARLGLQEGQNLYDTDLSQFTASYNPDMINAQTVAKQDEVQKYMALARLAGQTPQFLSDPTKANTARGVTFDQSQLKSVLDGTNATVQELAGQANNLRGAFDYMNSGEQFNGQLGNYTNANELADIINNNSHRPEFQAAMNGHRVGRAYQNLGSLVDWAKNYSAYNPKRVVTKK